MSSKFKEIQNQLVERGYDGAIVIGFNDNGFGIFMTDDTDESLAIYLLAKAQHILLSVPDEIGPTLQ